MSQFEWSESGKQLLRIFEQKIKEHGGHFSLWSKMRKEVSPVRIKHNRPAKRTHYILGSAYIHDNWNKLTLTEIAQAINKPLVSVSRQAKRMGLRSKKNDFINRGKYVQMEKGKRVINKDTGVIYPSIRQAALSIGMDRQNLRRRLYGVVTNNTGLELL